MKQNELIKIAISFIVFVLLHTLLFKHFVFLDVALCFLYIGFILTLPISIPMPILLFVGFFTGFFVDLFYDTIGIHIAATLIIVYIKPRFVALLTPLGGYDEINDISIESMGMRRFITYCFIIIFIHSFVVFFMESAGFSFFYMTILKTFFTSILTCLFVVLIQYIIFTPKN